MAINGIVLIITLLISQGIIVYNIKSKAVLKELLKEETEILTIFSDIADYKIRFGIH